jgi:hypothetical protein
VQEQVQEQELEEEQPLSFVVFAGFQSDRIEVVTY